MKKNDQGAISVNHRKAPREVTGQLPVSLSHPVYSMQPLQLVTPNIGILF